MVEIENSIPIFEYNDLEEDFQEIDYKELIKDNEQLYKILDSDFILLFIDNKRKKVWVWHGSNTTVKMRVAAIRKARQVRDERAFSFRLLGINDDNEPLDFKIFVGLEKEEDHLEDKIEPEYKGTEEDDKKIELSSLEEILLKLEKAGVPEGYERKLVIVNNNLYYYKKYDEIYYGSNVKAKRLLPLIEVVEDGPYLMKNYVPRLILFFNKVIIIELLQKININKKISTVEVI